MHLFGSLSSSYDVEVVADSGVKVVDSAVSDVHDDGKASRNAAQFDGDRTTQGEKTMPATTPQSRRIWESPIRMAVAAIFAGAGAGPVLAQTASDSTDTALPDVVITATKRATSLQQTPVAVTAISGAALEDAHVQTIEDVVHLAPSFQATTEGDHDVITMTLRGIGNDSAKTEYADPEVALFVDGIYAPRAEGAAALLFDLESVEVLRGPQGTLWGRNSTVGAVNMQTVKPALGESSAEIEGGMGNYNRFGVRGAFNVAIDETTAVRFAFVHEQHEGYVQYQAAPQLSLASQQAAAAPVISAYNAANPANPIAFEPLNPNLFVQGGPRYDAQDQSALRLSLLWHPNAALNWNISYEYFADRGTPNINLAQDPRAGQPFWSALVEVAPYLDRDVSTVRSRLDYNIGDAMTLSSITGFSNFSGASDFDQAGGAKVPTSFTTGATYQEDRTNESRYLNYSEEIELQSAGQRDVDWILGLYYAGENNNIRFDIPIMNGTQAGTVSWQGSFIQPHESVQSDAAFGQATWNLSEQLHLTGGLRYTHDDRKNEGGTDNGWVGGAGVAYVPVSINSNVFAPGSGFSPYLQNSGSYSGGKATYLARVNYDVSKDFLTYASVSSGYKSGGLQDGGLHYGPETLTNYELGSKQTLLGGTLKFNNAVYYEDFKDFQFSAPVTNPNGTHSLATSNAEGAKVYGLESELAARITRDDRVQLSATYMHTQLGYLIAGSNDYSLPVCSVAGISNCLNVTGHELPHAPTFTAQLQYEHKVHLASGATLAPRASVHYETASWLSVFNLGPGDQQAAYARADLGLRYTAAKAWWVDGYVMNVTNDKVKTNASNSFGVWQSQYLPPLTFGFNTGYQF
jgi:iron complex outermembrane receptor protein